MPDNRINPAELERNQIGAGLRALMDEIHEMAAQQGHAEAHSLKLDDLTPAREGIPEVVMDFAARRGVVEITDRPDGATISPRPDYQRKTARIDGSEAFSLEQVAEARESEKAKELARRILRRLAVEQDGILQLSKLEDCIHHPAFSRALTGLYEAGVVGMVKANGKYLVRLAANPRLADEGEIPAELPEEQITEAPASQPDWWADDLYEKSADTTYDGTNPDGFLVSPEIIADRVDQDGEFRGSSVGEEAIDILD